MYVQARRNKAATATNGDAGVTITRQGDALAFGVYWSYSDTPTGGGLTVTGGGDAFDVDITTAGPGFLPFDSPLGGRDFDLVVTLKAGGAGVVGKLNVLYGNN